MKGKIDKFDNSKTGTSKFGDWTLTVITIDGKDYTSFEELECKYGDVVEFDAVEKEGKLNIGKGSLKVLEEGTEKQPELPTQNPTQRDHRYDKDPAGLAVDVFVAMLNKETRENFNSQGIMSYSCDLVKQAQEYFK